MLARWSLGRVPKSWSSPLSTSRISTVVRAADKAGLKALAICTGKHGTARQANIWWMRTWLWKRVMAWGKMGSLWYRADAMILL